MKRFGLTGTAAALALVLGTTATACSTTDGSGTPGRSASGDPSPATGRSGSAVLHGSGTAGTRAAEKTLSFDAAVAAARDRRPGTVESADADHDRSGRYWEVDLLGTDHVRYEARVDADTGAVRVVADPGDDADAGDRALLRARVDIRAAARAALATVPGTVVSADFDADDDRPGHYGWETEVRGRDGADHELMVDATTGRVTVDRSDRDGDDD